MVKPDTFLIQEIKTLPAKAKVVVLWCTDAEVIVKPVKWKQQIHWSDFTAISYAYINLMSVSP